MKNCRKQLIMLIIFSILILLIITIIALPVTVTNSYNIKIVDKYIKDYDYYIYTEDLDTKEHKTFIIKDEVLKFRFDSSDVYKKIEIGKCYEIQSIGFQIDNLNIYENAIKYENIPS